MAVNKNFRIKVKAEIDTKDLRSQLSELSKSDTGLKIKITKVDISKKVVSDALKSALEGQTVKISKFQVNAKSIQREIANTLKNTPIKISNFDVDTSKLAAQIRKSLKANGFEMADGKDSKGSATDKQVESAVKSLVKLDQQVSSTINKFERMGGSNNPALSGLKAQAEEVRTLMDSLYNRDGMSNKEFLGAFSNTRKELENLKLGLIQTEIEAKKYQKIMRDIATNKTESSFADVQKKYTDMGGKNNKDLYKAVAKDLEALEQLKKSMRDNYDLGTASGMDAAIRDYEKYGEVLERVKNNIKNVKAVQGGQWADTAKISGLLNQMRQLEHVDTTNLNQKLQQGLLNGGMSASEFASAKAELSALTAENRTFSESAQRSSLSWKQFVTGLMSGFSAYSVISRLGQAVREMVENVRNVDTAMTELKKVTNETPTSYANYITAASKTAKEIGATVPDIISSTADFARLGYTFEEAQQLARTANVYLTVGDDLQDIDQASEHIISTMAAYNIKADDAITITDKFNEVGNKFAISSGGIGEALTRSASSFKAAGNDIDQSIALITAANTVVQDPASVGTAFKTLTMRIRGAESELEAAGEDTEGMAKSTAKLRKDMLQIAGIDILDSTGTAFRSTYDILDDLSKVWSSLKDIDQANILELIAGKRQGNIVASMMNNFGIARNALKVAQNAEGSAEAELEKALQGLDAKINQFKASWESLSLTIMDTNLVKGTVDFGSGLISGIDQFIQKVGTIPALLGAVASAFSLVTGKGIVTKDMFSNMFSSISQNGIKQSFTNLTKNFASGFQGFKQNISGLFKTFKESGLTGVYGSLKGSLSSLFNNSIKTGALNFQDNSGTIKNDQALLKNYIQVLRDRGGKKLSYQEGDAEKYLQGASKSALETAKAFDKISYTKATKNVREYVAGAKAMHGYGKSEYLEQMTTFAKDRSLSNIKGIIGEFNKQTSQGTVDAKEFGKAIAQTNQSLGNYLANVKKDNQASTSGYIKSMLKNGAVNVLGTLGSAVANGVISMGASWLISGAIDLIKRPFEEAQKVRTAQMEAAKEAANQYTNVNEAYTSYKQAQSAYATNAGSKEQLTDATNNLISALGLESSEVSNLINQYGSLDAALSATSKAKMNASIKDMKIGLAATKDQLKSEVGFFTNEILVPDEDAQELLKRGVELTDRGYGYEITMGNSPFGYFANSEKVTDFYKQVDDYLDYLTEIKTPDQLANDDLYLDLVSWQEKGKEYLSQIYDYEKTINSNALQSTYERMRLTGKTAGLGFEELTRKVIEAANATGELTGAERDWNAVAVETLAQNSELADIYKTYQDNQKYRTNSTLNGLLTSQGEFAEDVLRNGYNPDGKTSHLSQEERDLAYDKFATKVDNNLRKNYKVRELIDKAKTGLITSEDITEAKKTFGSIFDLSNLNAENFLDYMYKIQSQVDDALIFDLSAAYNNADTEEAKAAIQSIISEIYDLQSAGSELTFDIAVETEGIENFNTALTESNSASGLTAESITNLTNRYSQLQHFDSSKLFGLASGVRLNATELRKLESEYEKMKKQEIDQHLESLAHEYERVAKIIRSNPGDTAAQGALQDLATQIEQVSLLQAEYEGLTSAYTKWVRASQGSEAGDNYESVPELLKSAQELHSKGYIGKNEYREAIDFGTYEDQATKTAQELSAESGAAFERINRYFTEGSTGVNNFLHDLAAARPEMARFNEETKSGMFDMPVEEMAKALNLDVSAVAAILGELSDYGWDIQYDQSDSNLRQIQLDAGVAIASLDELQEMAGRAESKLKELGRVDDNFKFDFETTDLKSLESQIGVMQGLLDDYHAGNVGMNTDELVEAETMLVSLISRKQQLEAPAYMHISVQGREPVDQFVSKIQELKTNLNNLEINVAAHADTSEAQSKIETIASEIQKLTQSNPEILASLGIKQEDLNNVLQQLQSKDVEVKAKVKLADNVDKLLNPLTEDKFVKAGGSTTQGEGVIEYTGQLMNEDELLNKKGTISYEEDKKQSETPTKTVNGGGTSGAFSNSFMFKMTPVWTKNPSDLVTEASKTKTEITTENKIVDVHNKTFTGEDLESTNTINDKRGTEINISDQTTTNTIDDKQGVVIVPRPKKSYTQYDDRQGKTFTPKSKVSYTTYNERVGTTYRPTPKSSTVTYHATTVNLPQNLTRTVTYIAKGGGGGTGSNAAFMYTGSAITKARAYYKGSAYARGSWGIRKNERALVGELGVETIARNGKYFTVGHNGPELVNLHKDDIIFNHRQTEEIFKNGILSAKDQRLGEQIAGMYGHKGYAKGSGNYSTLNIGGKNFGINTTYAASIASSAAKSLTNAAARAQIIANKNSKDSNTKADPKIFDWIETALDRLERKFKHFKAVADSTFNVLATRMGHSADAMKTATDKLNAYQKAYDRYISEANSISLSEDVKKSVREGAIDITYLNDDVAEKAEEYKKFYEAALDAKDAIDDLTESLAQMYQERFENTQKDYENQLDMIQYLVDSYENGLTALETKGQFGAATYYQETINAQLQMAEKLKKEYDELNLRLAEATNSNLIAVGSEAWYDMMSAINDVDLKLQEVNNDILKMQKNIRELEWERFDWALERMTKLNDEAEFFIDLMDINDLFDDKGQMTKYGEATMGLYAQQFDTYMFMADQYGEELLKVSEELANDPYNQEIIERYEELNQAQQDAILKAKDQKEAIRDLIEQGYKKQIDSLGDVIDKYLEALSAQNDLYDYQKKVEEQTKKVADLQKRQMAYANDTSEKGKMEYQKISVDLSEAMKDLAEIQQDRTLSEQKKLLNGLQDEYEELLNARLDNIDVLISESIAHADQNSAMISNTLKEEGEKNGYRMTDSLTSVWDNKVLSTLSEYNGGFKEQLNAVTNVLIGIRSYTDMLKDAAEEEARLKAEEVKRKEEEARKKAEAEAKKKAEEEAKRQQQAAASASKPSTSTAAPAPAKKVGIGSTINAGNARIYADSYGQGGGTQYFAYDPIYTVVGENNGYWLVRWHKHSSGYTGWFKKSDVKAYKTGGLADETGMAWLDGTKSKPEMVLNARDTQAFLALTEALRQAKVNMPSVSSMFAGSAQAGNTFNGGINFNVLIDHVDDYNDLVSKMQHDPKFEKVVQAMTIDQLSKGSSSMKKYNYKF